MAKLGLPGQNTGKKSDKDKPQGKTKKQQYVEKYVNQIADTFNSKSSNYRYKNKSAYQTLVDNGETFTIPRTYEYEYNASDYAAYQKDRDARIKDTSPEHQAAIYDMSRSTDEEKQALSDAISTYTSRMAPKQQQGGHSRNERSSYYNPNWQNELDTHMLKLTDEDYAKANERLNSEKEARLQAQSDKFSNYNKYFTAYNFDDYVEKGKQMAIDNGDVPQSDYEKSALEMKNKYYYSLGTSTAENLSAMTDDEKNLYYYLLGSKGEDAAKEFETLMQETLNYRLGEIKAGNAYDVITPFVSNLQGAFSSAGNAVLGAVDATGLGKVGHVLSGNKITDYEEGKTIPTSAAQYGDQLFRSNMTGVRKVANDLTATLANQVPSIALTYITGGLGGSAQLARLAGSLLMGLGAAGSTYKNSIDEGYSVDQSALYGALNGLSETTLESILGGVMDGAARLATKATGVNSGTLSTTLAKVYGKVLKNHPAIATALGNYSADVIREFIEEASQEAIDPIIKGVATGERGELKLDEETLYSGILGALSAGIMNTPVLRADIRKGNVFSNLNTVSAAKGIRFTGLPGMVESFDNATNIAEAAARASENTTPTTTAEAAQRAAENAVNPAEDTVTPKVENNATPAAETAVTSDAAANFDREAATKALTEKSNYSIPNTEYTLGIKQNRKASRDERYVATLYNSDGSSNVGSYRTRTEAVNALVDYYESQISPAQTTSAITQESTVQMETPAETNAVTPAQAAVTSTLTSDSGRTAINSNGDTVTVGKIVGTGNDAVVQTSNGNESISDIEFDNPDINALYEAATQFSENTANTIVNDYTGTTSVDNYLRAVNSVYQSGKSGLDYDAAVNKSLYAKNYLEADTRMAVYAEGLAEYNKNRTKSIEGQKGKNIRQPAKGEYKAGVNREYSDKKLTSSQRKQLRAIDEIFKAAGKKIVVHDSIGSENGKVVYSRNSNANAYYDPNTDTYHLSLDSVGEAYAFITCHESVHEMRAKNPEDFDTLQLVVWAAIVGNLESQINEQTGKIYTEAEAEAEFEKMVQYQMGKVGTREAAIEEVVANTVPVILTDVEQGKRFAEEVMHSTSKVKAWFEQLLKDLREILDKAYNILKDEKSWKQMEIVRNKATIDTIADVYFEGMKGTKGKTANSDSTRYSIFTTEDGKQYVEADRDVITGNDPEKWAQQVEDYINNEIRHGRDVTVYSANGVPLTITADTAGKATFRNFVTLSDGSKRPMTDSEYARKLNAESHIDEIAQVSRGTGSTVPDMKNHSFAKDGFNYRTAYFKDNSGYYELRLSVGKNGNVNTIYNVGKITEADFPTRGLKGPTRSKTETRNQASADTFSQKDTNVKRFSMKDAVEATDDLIAVHNLDRKGLEGALELGGFPMPSIAITKSDMGHTEFGDISVIFGRDTIDPATNKANNVYGGDAYTPTFPEVGYKPSQKVIDRLQSLLRKARKNAAETNFYLLEDLANATHNTLKRLGGDEENIIDDLTDNTDMMQAYLVDQDKQPIATVWRETVTEISEIRKAEYDAIKKALGKEAFEKLGDTDADFQAWGKKYGDACAAAIKQAHVERGADEAQAEYFANRARNSSAYIYNARNYLLTGKPDVRVEADTDATQKAIREAVDEEKYRAWLKDIFSGIVEKRGIYNGKGPLTNSGNRRSFEQLYWEYNLENVVKAMKLQDKKGAAGLGAKNLYGASTKEYGSVADVKADSHRLQKVPPEEYKEMRDIYSARLADIAYIYAQNNGVNRWNAANVLCEAIAKRKTRDGVWNYLNQGQRRAYYDLVDDLISLANDISQMPTEYFEAKPERAVGLDEIKAAILPEGKYSDLQSKLENMGIPVKTYDPGVENSRVKAMNSDFTQPFRFSKKDNEQHAVSEFGTTYSWSETGYITPNGKQLDFSGKKDGGPSGRRSMDHREVESLYEADGISGSDAMVKFMGEGNIRISPEIGGINLQSLPTKAQFDKLQAFVRKNNGEVTIDFDDADGNTLHSIDYPKGTGPVRVNNDIRRFYEEGTVPALSDTLRYRFSQKDTREEAQREVTAKYKQQAREILNGVEQKGLSLLVGFTPDIYRKLGMPGLPFVVGSGHVYSMAKTKAEAQAEGRYHKGVNYHGMGDVVVENILDYVEDPIMVIAAKDVNASATPLRSTHSVVALVNIGKGKDSMVIPIAITAERYVDGMRMDVNAISSAYERNVAPLVNEAIAQFNTGESSIFYVKKEAANLIGAGVQFPEQLKIAASSDGIVAKLSSKINMLVQNATESQQFKRWFGDWQNNPAEASKAVTKKGVPLLLYHYTDKKFTVFDISRSGSNQGSRLGDGTYLSSSETEFVGYGKYKMVLYANIRNPFEMQLTEKQAKYVLEKYGATKHDLDSHGGLYREHAMSKLTNPIRVMDYLKEYAKDNGIRTSDILKDLKYDGIHDGTEWVVFDPTQIKSATDNIGTFDGTNPDILFSRKDGVSVTAEDARKLQKENEKLKQALEVAKQEIKLSDGHHVKQSDVERLAKNLLKEYSSTMDRTELVNNLTELFDYIGNGENVVWDEVQAGAMNIAYNILDASEERDTTLYDAYSNVREYLRGTPIRLNETQKAEAKHISGSYTAFRREMMGKLVISDKASLTLEDVWIDLESMDATTFSRDIGDADMPGVLYDFLQKIYERPIINPNKSFGDMKGLASYVALNLYSEYMNMPERKTFADKQQKKLELLRAKYNNRIENIRESYESKLEKQEERLAKQKATYETRLAKQETKYETKLAKQGTKLEEQKAKLAEQKEEYKAKLEEQKATQKEKLAVDKYRTRIRKTAQSLAEMLTKNDNKKHVPEEIRKSVAAVLNRIDFEGTNWHGFEKALSKMQAKMEQLDKLSESENVDTLITLSPEFVDCYNSFMEHVDIDEDMDMRKLNSEQLKTLDLYLSIIKNAVITANTIISDGRRAQIGEIARNVVRRAQEKPARLRQVLRNHPHAAKVANMAEKILSTGNAKPIYFFDNLGGEMKSLFNDVRQGTYKAALNVNKAKVRFAKIQEKYNYSKWADKKGDILYVTTDDGSQVPLTREQALDIYATHKREEMINTQHLTYDGFVFQKEVKVNEKNGKVEAIGLKDYTNKPLNDNAFAEINDWLTDEQRAYADALVEYMSTDGSKLGNEVTQQMYGINRFTEGYYVPLITAQTYINGTYRKDSKQNKAWANKGFTKNTVEGANSPIIIMGITEKAAKHMNDMAAYNGLAIPQESLTRVYNAQYLDPTTGRHTSVRNELAKAYGDNTLSYIDNFLGDISAGVTTDMRDSEYGALVSMYKRNAVAGKLSVAIQQPAAIMHAMAMIDPKYFFGKVKKGIYDTMMRYSGTAVMKEIGGFDINTGKGTTNWIAGNDKLSIKEAVTGWLPQWMDKITWCRIWTAVENEVVATTDLERGSEEFYQAVGRRFDDVVEYTQVYDSTISRSELMRSKSFWLQLMTSFKAEPTKTYNMMWYAVKHANEEGGKTRLIRTSAAIVGQAVLVSMLKSIITAAMDDDDDQAFIDKYVEAIAGNLVGSKIANIEAADIYVGGELDLVGGLPIVSEIVSMLQGFTNRRSEFQMIYDWWSATTAIFDADSKKTMSERLSKAAKTTAAFFGIPLDAVERQWFGVAKAAYKLITGSDPEKSGNIGYEIREGLGADQEAELRRSVDEYMNTGDPGRLDKQFGTMVSRSDANNPEQDIGKKVGSIVREYFDDGEIERDEAAEMLTHYGYTDEDAESTVTKWDFWSDFGAHDTSMESNTDTLAAKYYDYAEAAGVDKELYYDVYKFKSKNKKDEVLAYINKQDLARKQKDALFLTFYAKSGLDDVPWR